MSTFKSVSLLLPLPKQVSVPRSHQVAGSQQRYNVFTGCWVFKLCKPWLQHCHAVQKFSELQKWPVKVHGWKMPWELTGTKTPTVVQGVCHTQIPGNQVQNLAEHLSFQCSFTPPWYPLPATVRHRTLCYMPFLIHCGFFHVLNHAVIWHICTCTTASRLGEDGNILYSFNYCWRDLLFLCAWGCKRHFCTNTWGGNRATATGWIKSILSSENRNVVGNIFKYNL